MKSILPVEIYIYKYKHVYIDIYMNKLINMKNFYFSLLILQYYKEIMLVTE